MAPQKHPLQPRYGKLTVIGEAPGSNVSCRCDCGVDKIVSRSNLLAGRVRSCGRYECRVVSTATKRGPKPKLPQWIAAGDIRQLWADHQTMDTTALADRLKLHPHTLYAFWRKVEKAGGIDTYLAAMTASQPAVTGLPKRPPLAPPVPVPQRATSVPKPPADWRK